MMVKGWLIRLAGKTRWYILGQVAASWVSLAANIGIIYAIAKLLQAVCEGSVTGEKMAETLGIALMAMAVRMVCALIASNMSFHASDEVKRILREKIYRKLCALGLSYSETIGTGEAVQIAGEGVDQLEVYFGSYLPQLFYSMLAPVTLFFVFLPISVKAAVALMVCVPLIPLSIIGVQKIARRLLKEYWGVYTDLGGTFLDNVQGLTTLKIYEADKERHQKMNAQAESFRRITMRVLYMQLNSITVMDIIAYGGAAAGILLAALELRAGNISLSGAVMILLLSADFFIPLRQLGSFFHVAMNGMAASEKMKALFDLPEDAGKRADFPKNGGFSLEHMDFSYDGKRTVLKDVSLCIKEKSFTALVGESGCGKSTVASLLTGALKETAGSVKAGNRPLSAIKEESLLKQVTLIKHNAFLFHGTVRENLLMAKPNATDEELILVLKAADAYEFLLANNGLDTLISEQGANFSGGEKQRIAIARALLHDTPVYIFDEATSNIDAESEEAVMRAVKSLAGKKTVLLISHRLANVTEADVIYVLEAGRVCEQGTHAGLMQQKSRYYTLYEKQQSLENFGRRGVA